MKRTADRTTYLSSSPSGGAGAADRPVADHPATDQGAGRSIPGRALTSALMAGLAMLLLALPAAQRAMAQENDDTWNGLDTLNPEDYSFESDLIGHYSHGWFPQANTGRSLSISSTGLFSDVYDVAHGIRPRSFVPTTAPFDGHDPYDGGERTILKTNSDEEADEGYPTTSYTEYMLRYTYNLPMPAVLRASAGLRITDGILFSDDTTRSYLGLNGAPQPLKEVGVAHLKEYLLAGSIGVNIPVYGVFLESEAASIASYYYLHVGVTAAYSMSSRLTQYAQIANAKSELRYGNGVDTVTLLYRSRLEDLNKVRTSIDLAVGWNFAIEFFTFSLEAFGSYPLDQVVNDADWRQYYVGLRGSIGYQWLPESKQ